MPYATQSDMVNAFGTTELVQLTDLEQPHTGAIVPAVLERALDDASAEIDGYLAGRYTVPLATPPRLMRVHCCDIARYRLMTASPDERVKQAYDAAISFLKLVAKGDITLYAPEAAPSPAGVGPVLFNAGSKVMGRDAYLGGDE
jgi:phage gp36-like protein